MLPGYASVEGTAAYRKRFSGILREDHFREAQGIYLSSIGIGSYLGASDEETDRGYGEALKKAVSGGINLIDTAVNYRSQRSERCFGKALEELVSEGTAKREEVVVCTKGGFLPFDGNYPPDPLEYFHKTYIEKGILKEEEIAQNCHAMTPAYLEDQLGRSLANLGLETIDVYYLHNPETQLARLDRVTFRAKVRDVFEWMEEKVREGKIRYYGAATWNGLRVPERESEYLSLEDMHLIAREVAGTDHHFKFVQLPANLAMPEAWVLPAQRFGAGAVPLLTLAQRLSLTVIASASLMQAKLTGPFPAFLEKHFRDLETSAQRAIQFARSLPGLSTALVGMKTVDHVAENLKAAQVKPFTEDELVAMFQNA